MRTIRTLSRCMLPRYFTDRGKGSGNRSSMKKPSRILIGTSLNPALFELIFSIINGKFGSGANYIIQSTGSKISTIQKSQGRQESLSATVPRTLFQKRGSLER